MPLDNVICLARRAVQAVSDVATPESRAMRIVLPPIAGVAVLALLWLSGAMAAADLAHPFWQTRATLAGGGAGAAVALGLLALAGRRGRRLRVLLATALIGLAAAGLVTWRAARVFIDSPDFEPLAGKLWFLGYHTLAALIVIAIALALAARRHRQGPLA